MFPITLYTVLNLLLTFPTVLQSHSWLHCSNYKGEETGYSGYDDSLCLGYTRYWIEFSGQDKAEFGVADQRGATGSNGNWCPAASITSPIESNYDDDYPYATYSIGEEITLAWPAKNHAIGDGCGNQFTTDAGMKLYVNPTVNPTNDPDNLDDWILVIDWHEQDGTSDYNLVIEGRPYSNCPNYCEDTDKAPCYGKFTVSSDIFTQSGFYTFMWYWNFGSPFTTCYEAYIDVDTVVTDDNDDEENNGGDDNSDSNEDSDDSATYYNVAVIVCYEGAAYDVNMIEGAMEELYDGRDWSIIDYNEINDNEFNVTVNVVTEQSGMLYISNTMSNGTLCNQILDEYGNIITHDCSVACSLGIYTSIADSSNLNKSNNNDNDNYKTGVLIAFIIVITIILVVVIAALFYKRQQNKNNPVASGKHNETIISGIHGTSTQQNGQSGQKNIVVAED